MKASELLGRRVLGPDGAAVGVVHDVRVAIAPDSADSAGTLTLTALVVGPDTWRCRLAHAWGYAQGRTIGPGPLRRLLQQGASAAVAVPVADVAAWDDQGRVLLSRLRDER